MTGTLHEELCTFLIISRLILLRIRNVSDESCRETQNTHFVFSNFFSKNRAVYEIMWENMIEPDRPQVTLRLIPWKVLPLEIEPVREWKRSGRGAALSCSCTTNVSSLCMAVSSPSIWRRGLVHGRTENVNFTILVSCLCINHNPHTLDETMRVGLDLKRLLPVQMHRSCVLPYTVRLLAMRAGLSGWYNCEWPPCKSFLSCNSWYLKNPIGIKQWIISPRFCCL
jgi:hypothetical protein